MLSLFTPLLLVLAILPRSLPAETVTVRLTAKPLVPRCLDGVEIKDGARHWQLTPGEHTLTVTTNNQPRSGIPPADPGVAVIRFSLEAAHHYEVELRAPSGAYSLRVWKKGEWTPVVRDAGTDHIVSGEVAWTDGSCK